jgi:hypothetical protein
MDKEEKEDAEQGAAEQGGAEKKRLAEGIEIIIGEAKSAAGQALTGAEALGESLKETLQGALSKRKNVVMVRLNEESLACLDDLVEAAIVNSRSEAAAFLIGEGVKARSALFERISEKTEQIRKVKQELRDLLGEEPLVTPPDGPTGEDGE